MLTATVGFSSVFFNPAMFRPIQAGFSAHRGALIITPDLTFPVFCNRFVDLAVQSKFDSGAILTLGK